MTIKLEAVIFDYGCVLCFNIHPKVMEDMQSICQMRPQDFLQEYWKQRPSYDAGVISEKEYWNLIVSKYRSPLKNEDLQKLTLLDNQGWSNHNEQMWQWLQLLKDNGLKIGLLSNMGHGTRDHLEQHFPEKMSLFHHKTFSCDVKVNKPEDAIYQHCFQSLSVDPAKALFLDDREENIIAAQKLGVDTIHFTTTQNCFEQTRQYQLPSLSISSQKNVI